MVDQSGILEPLQEIIRSCVETCVKVIVIFVTHFQRELTVSRLELCDDGIRSLRFRETVNSVLSEFGIEISFLVNDDLFFN